MGLIPFLEKQISTLVVENIPVLDYSHTLLKWTLVL